MQLILRERLLTSAVLENTCGHSSRLSAGISPNLQLYYPLIHQQSAVREFLKQGYKTGSSVEDAAGAACEVRFPIFTGCGKKSNAKTTLSAGLQNKRINSFIVVLKMQKEETTCVFFPFFV